MNFEVERKFCISDQHAFRARASRFGLAFAAAESQVDTYYGHPCRSFETTDEALRIRRAPGHCSITYKGPKTDTTSKTRQELDLNICPVDPGGERFDALLSALGFREVVSVKKSRETARIQHSARDFTICLDHAEGLGWFAEIETIATEAEVPLALEALDTLAAELQLCDNERRSYLELLLEQQKAGSRPT